jgi:hypothetical protein
MTLEGQVVFCDAIFAIGLGAVMWIGHDWSRRLQRKQSIGEDYARNLQQALARGDPNPRIPGAVFGLRPPPTGVRPPGGEWWHLSDELPGQQIKILMDVYGTMQRRLEHYRQLGITLVFGFFALFSLIDTALFRSDNDKPHYAAEGLVMELLALLAVVYGYHLLSMVRKNFDESGAIIQRIERVTGMFEVTALLPSGPLLPADWPSGVPTRDNAEFRAPRWRDDIIPWTQVLILAVGWVEAVYVGYEYGPAFLKALGAAG